MSVVIISVLLLFRVADISTSEYAQAGTSQSTRRIDIAQSRGMIYDRNMVPLVNRDFQTVLVIDPTSEAMETLKESLDEDEFDEAEKLAEKGTPFLFYVEQYSGNSDDIIELTVYNRYSSDDIASQVIGYLDSEGNGATAIEKSFESLMDKYSGTLSVRYSADASGVMLRGQSFEIQSDDYASSGGLVLTLDYEIQRICEDVAERNELNCGAVVVLDAQTSEILALVSEPSFDRDNMASSLADSSSPFLNRALSSYSVGSVFKSIVAAAALESGISEDTVFECSGYVTVNGIRFNCHKKDGHGAVDMTEAMAVSCNSYFIQLGQSVGSEKIITLASQLGLGEKIILADNLVSVSGNLPIVADIDSSAALANLSFGQGALLATPLQMAAVYCTFVNGGYYREPYILKEIVDENGSTQAYYSNEINNKVLTDYVCQKICSMLEETVENGTGKLAKPMSYTAAGKTATAETGWTQDGRDIVHTWFAGYYPADEPKYVIVVFKEDGSSSSTECAPIFRDIADLIEW